MLLYCKYILQSQLDEESDDEMKAIDEDEDESEEESEKEEFDTVGLALFQYNISPLIIKRQIIIQILT